MAKPRIHLTNLVIRSSARGTGYMTGWIGSCRIIGFPGRPDKAGNRTWDIFIDPAQEHPHSLAQATTSVENIAAAIWDD